MNNADDTSPQGTAFAWQSHGISHVGRVRELNEDSLLMRPEEGLWVVADGMGGHSAGNTASQMIVQNIAGMPPHETLDGFVNAIEDVLLDTNAALLRMSDASVAEDGSRPTIGSTVVMMRAYETYCYYAWLGDSRVYRLRNGEIRQMTTDHSQVEEYVAQGLISRREASIHPHGNMVTRAVGATANMHLDMDMQEMLAGDRYLLCSDGVTKHVGDLELQDLLGHGDVRGCCLALTKTVLERGAGDNLTAVVVSILPPTN